MAARLRAHYQKSVLPALVPQMTYEGMEVADGQAAGLAWESFVHGGLEEIERERIRKALLDYCGQDTLAMLRLLERLKLETTGASSKQLLFHPAHRNYSPPF